MLVEDILQRLKDADPKSPVLVQVGAEPTFMVITGVMSYGDRTQDWSEEDKAQNVESDDCGNELTDDCLLIRVD